MKRLFTILPLLSFMLSIASINAQTNLWTEDFETDGEGVRYTNSNTFHDGTADYYTRTNGTTPSIGVSGGPYVTVDGSFYFAGEDIDDNGGDLSTIKIFTKTGIDITGYANLSFKGLFGSGATGAWDVANDQVLVEAQINGGGYTRILSFSQDGSSGTNFNSLLAQDVDGDGLGEGIVLTPTLADFTGAITGTGTTLDIRITSNCGSGGEEFAFDYLRVEGVLPSGNAEINLQSSTAMPIVDGDTSPSAGEGTDFGAVEVGMTSSSSITILNSGGADLTVGAITISGANMADFIITNYTAGIIASGGNMTFDIEFSPSSAAVKNAMISIVNDDSDENPYEFDITGEGFSLEEIAITEFFTNPNGVEPNSEFVEIYNYGATPIDLNGWRIKDEDTDTDIISTTSLIIEPGEYLVLVANKIPFETNWLNGNVCPNVIEVGGLGLANGTDEIVLENGTGNIVWSLAYQNDDTSGSATHYTEANFTNRFWGSKASPGVDRSGNDVTGSLGYEKNSITADALTFASADGDMGSPLNRTNCYEREIDVQGGASLASIMNGDATPEAADGTEVIAIIGMPSIQTFTIENQGSVEDLTVTGITSNNGDFMISGATFPLVIPVGMTATFTVGFTSTMISSTTATITVANDDADEGTYTFDVSTISPDLTAGDGCTTAVSAAVDASGTMVHFLDASNRLVASVSSTGTDFSASGDEISIHTNVASGTNNTATDGNLYLIMGRQFNIESLVTAPYTGLTVRLYFNNSDYSDLSSVSCPSCPTMTSPSDIEVSHYDGTSQNCDQSDNDFITTPSENLGGAYGTYGSTAFYIEVNPTHFSEFFGHQTNSIVFPVELTFFEAIKSGQDNILHWQTATEINNELFVIERRDHISGWKAIGDIRGAGDSTHPIDYSFIDKNVESTQYYRLKQIDFDGAFSYSDIVSIVRKENADVASEFYPNPSHTKIVQMDYISTQDEVLVISGFDLSGKLVFREMRNVVNGPNQLTFGFKGLDTGFYIIKLQAGDQQIQRKLILD